MSQMTFSEVVEMEVVPGDPAYVQWLAAGRPSLDEKVMADPEGEPLPSEGARSDSAGRRSAAGRDGRTRSR